MLCISSGHDSWVCLYVAIVDGIQSAVGPDTIVSSWRRNELGSVLRRTGIF